MRRATLMLLASGFLLGAAEPSGCRAPWNPPEPGSHVAADRSDRDDGESLEHPDLDERFAGKTIREWIALLSSEVGRERKDAAYKLGEAGDNAWVAVPALIEALQSDPDMGVRSLSAQALGKIGPRLREVVPALEHAFYNDDHNDVRTAASKALARNGVVLTKKQ